MPFIGADVDFICIAVFGEKDFQGLCRDADGAAFELNTRRRRPAMSSAKSTVDRGMADGSLYRAMKENQTAQGRRRIGARLKGQCAHRETRIRITACLDGCRRKVTPRLTLAVHIVFPAP
jgi:hypothetical protein